MSAARFIYGHHFYILMLCTDFAAFLFMCRQLCVKMSYMNERNILLKIAYDGTNFSGWQRQSGARTVCGELEEVLAEVCGIEVTLEGCSRTDAGVHALGQTASFLLNSGIPTERIVRAVNDRVYRERFGRCGEIEILEAREMPPEFHARFSSKGKRYIYRIRNAEKPDIFLRDYCFQIEEPLDIEAMKLAAGFIVGRQDFACFQSAGGTPRENTVRTVFEIDLKRSEQMPEMIEIAVAGDGFLYNMVRIICGTLVETGLGRRAPREMEDIIASRDRSRAGLTAPPGGLYLKEVFY